MSLPVVKAKLLEGRKGLIVGIANDRSIAWGCARAFRAFGAELAVTYLNDKAKPHVEPLAREVEAAIFMPMDMSVPGQLEAVFERIAETWGELDFLVHSIAFSPKDTLGGRVIDAPRDGFLATMDVSCWSFIRMGHLAEPLMKKGGTLFTMTYYGSQMVVENYNIMGVAKAALESAVRYMAAELGPKGIRVHAISPGPLATRAASGIPEFDALLEKAKIKAPARELVGIDDVGVATAFLAHDAARLITGQCSTSTAAITLSTRSRTTNSEPRTTVSDCFAKGRALNLHGVLKRGWSDRMKLTSGIGADKPIRSRELRGAQIGALILATSIVQLANGFFGTFVSLRVAGGDFGATMAGFVLSSYFAGYTVGAVRADMDHRTDRAHPRLRCIRRVGHRRDGGHVAPDRSGPVADLARDYRVWVRRTFRHDGELAERQGPTVRARTRLLDYMLGTFVALALGQLLIGRAQLESAAPFTGIVALFAVALVIVCAARAQPPRSISPLRLPYGDLTLAAPTAVLGSALRD